MPVVSADLSKRLVPDELWELVGPFTAVAYVLTSGCAWQHLPPTFGTSSATAHRRFTVWTGVGLWRRLHRAVLDELGVRGEVDWTSTIVDASSVRANGGSLTGPHPGRSWQEGQQAARLVRCPGHPARRRRVGCEHARQPRLQAAHPWHPGRPVRPGAPTAPACQTSRGQGALLRRTPHLAARAWACRAHRAARHRVRRTPRPAPLEDRTVDRLALRLPPPEHPIRTKGLALLALAAALTCYKELAKLAT